MFKLLILLLNFSYADLNYSLDSLFYLQKSEIADSVINPQNQIFKSPFFEGRIDLRAELKWREGANLIVVRPRLEAYQIQIEYAQNQDTESKSKFDLTDAFYENYWNSYFATTFGLQVYQWGPAEFLNASNPLYHFNSKQKSATFKDKGQVLLRANYFLNKENSLVFILQPISNAEAEWIAEDQFTPKAILKYEKSWPGSSNYFGIVFGNEERSNLFFGEYFNYNFTEEFSIYADIKHSQNRINYTTEKAGNYYNLIPEADYNGQWPTFAVFGMRWEGNFDVRTEYIYNGMGFNHNELNALIVSAGSQSNPSYIQNFQRFLKPGLEMLGQNYLYFSYRVSDPFSLKDLNFYTRYIHSFQDDSGLFQLEFDKSFLDSYSVFSNLSIVNGAVDSEFRLINDWQALMGLKWFL